jgi:hypothetical protein
MKRRRHKLEVSTFPFLAVLLCAMGSLILLLLVIDRRAKAVARAKALQAAAKAEAEDVQLAAARAAELEQRRKALHALLAQQDQELLGQIKSLYGQSSEAAQKVQKERQRFQELRGRLSAASAKLTDRQKALVGRRAEVAKESDLSQAKRTELAALTAELEQLEQTLAAMKLLRQRDQQTYSIVPYRGKRGDNRKPIYVECTAGGLILHPEHTTVDRPEAIRAEIERRIGKQQAGDKKDANAYLLMLVRPDGIGAYYEAVSALHRLNVDFGYEFIENDWVLDFPSGDGTPAAQPWMTATAAKPPVKGVPNGRPTGSPDTIRPTPPGADMGMAAGGAGGGRFPGGGTSKPQGTIYVPGTPAVSGGVVLSSPYPAPAGTGGNGFGPRSPAPSGGAIRGFTSGPVTGDGGDFGSPGGIGLSPQLAGIGSGIGPAGRPGGSGGGFGADRVAMMPGARAGPAGAQGAAGTGGILGMGGPGGSGSPSAGFGTSEALRTGNRAGAPGGNGYGRGSVAGATNTDTGGPTTGGSGAPGMTARGNIENGSPFGPSSGANPATGGIGGSGSATGGAVNGSSGLGSGAQAGAAGPSAIDNVNAPPAQAPMSANPGGTGGNARAAAGAGGTVGPHGPPANGNPSGAVTNATGPADASGAPGATGPAGATNVAMAGTRGGGRGNGSPRGVLLGPAEEANDDGEPSGGDGRRNPLSRFLPAGSGRKSGRGARTRPLNINRDWPIPVECQADGVLVRSNLQHFSLAELARATNNPLLQSVDQLIARRQARVPEGEPPYRPLIQFRVHAGGMRAYYLAYPVLGRLNIPMTREDLEPEEELRSEKYGRQR